MTTRVKCFVLLLVTQLNNDTGHIVRHFLQPLTAINSTPFIVHLSKLLQYSHQPELTGTRSELYNFLYYDAVWIFGEKAAINVQ